MYCSLDDHAAENDTLADEDGSKPLDPVSFWKRALPLMHKLDEDCAKQVQNVWTYEEEIILGKVMQLFYHVPVLVQEQDIVQHLKETDETLKNIAQKYHGTISGTSQLRMRTRRRDIDFTFPSAAHAKQFRKYMKHTSTTSPTSTRRFHVHKHLRMDDRFYPKPSTTTEIQLRRAHLLDSTCITKVT